MPQSDPWPAKFEAFPAVFPFIILSGQERGSQLHGTCHGLPVSLASAADPVPDARGLVSVGLAALLWQLSCQLVLQADGYDNLEIDKLQIFKTEGKHQTPPKELSSLILGILMFTFFVMVKPVGFLVKTKKSASTPAWLLVCFTGDLKSAIAMV